MFVPYYARHARLAWSPKMSQSGSRPRVTLPSIRVLFPELFSPRVENPLQSELASSPLLGDSAHDRDGDPHPPDSRAGSPQFQLGSRYPDYISGQRHLPPLAPIHTTPPSSHRIPMSTPLPVIPPPPQLEAEAERPPGYNHRRYVCQICGHRFTRPSSLKAHQTTHTRERPFECSFPGCGRSYTVRSNLRRHMLKHRAQPAAAVHPPSSEPVALPAFTPEAGSEAGPGTRAAPFESRSSPGPSSSPVDQKVPRGD